MPLVLAADASLQFVDDTSITPWAFVRLVSLDILERNNVSAPFIDKRRNHKGQLQYLWKYGSRG